MIKMFTHPEALRRLAALVGLLMAIWFFLWPVEYVQRINLVDFAANQQGERWKDDRALPMEQYIAKRTKERLVEVQGPQWKEFFQALISAKNGVEPPLLQGRKYQISSRYAAYYYFGPDAEPMASLAHRTGPYTYLTMSLEGQRYYLGLDIQPYRWADSAPSWLLFPSRGYAWIPLVLGLLAYLLIPRRKRPEAALGYSRFSAQVMPDVLGLFLAGSFFALPLLIVPDHAGIWEVFDFFGGWGIITLFFWVLLAGWGVVILAMAARYAAMWLEVGEKDFFKDSLSGTERIAYAAIERVKPYQRRAPRWLVWGLLIFGRGNPTATGQALILDSRDSHGLEVQLKNGRRVRIATDGLPGVDRLLEAMDKAGVALD